MITTKNVSLTIKNKAILQNVSISLPKGSITTFIGKSGAGKTSLLKCLAQLYQDYQGDILYENKPLNKLTNKQRAHGIGFVFQQYHLFPHMTVMQNCVQPQVTVLGLTAEQAQAKVTLWLEALGLIAHKNAYPQQLSGGQQQRVAIARALVLEPQVLLFDEPSSALDPQSTKELALLLKSLHKKGITIGLCSHDIPFIKDVLDKVYLLEGGMVIDYHQASDGILAPERPIAKFLES